TGSVPRLEHAAADATRTANTTIRNELRWSMPRRAASSVPVRGARFRRAGRALVRRSCARARRGATLASRAVATGGGTPVASDRGMPARANDTDRISFGLVTIPVKIYSTSRPSEEIHFHLVHEGCGERLHQQYVCPEHGVVERDAMAKGF